MAGRSGEGTPSVEEGCLISSLPEDPAGRDQANRATTSTSRIAETERQAQELVGQARADAEDLVRQQTMAAEAAAARADRAAREASQPRKQLAEVRRQVRQGTATDNAEKRWLPWRSRPRPEPEPTWDDTPSLKVVRQPPIQQARSKRSGKR